MKYFFTCILFICLNNRGLSQTFDVEIFPDEKIYSYHLADAISPQLSLAKHFETSEWFGNIGYYLSAANLSFNKQIFQISLAATVFNTIVKTPGHIKVYTVDYLVDIYADTKINGNFIGRFTYGHLSAHYSDDGIIQLNVYPINYVRDYVALHSEYLINNINGKIYLGGFYNFHNEPVQDKHLTVQLGGDASVKIAGDLFFFGAFDIKIKSDVNNGTTQSFQAGVIYPYSTFPRIRFAFTHRRGFEERGQLFNSKDIKNMLGIYFDF
jgi:hypothetical protein